MLLRCSGWTGSAAAADAGGELELLVETIARVVPCPDCGAVGRAKDRRPVWVRDLPIGGRPVVVCWHKRVWCCPHALCSKKTWTEQHPAIETRACLTDRARAWAFDQVGAQDGAVSRVASALGVGWATIMRIVTTRGGPIIDDPARLDAPTAIGVDETAFLRATGQHPTMYTATGIADLTPGSAGAWRAQIATASLDPFRGYATALNQQLPQAVRVLDPFHVTKLGLTAVDQVRRRVQQDIYRHRGHRGDPLYGIRSHPAPPRRPALRAGLGSAAGRTRRRRPVRGGHRRLDHRPGPDALLPAPRRKRCGSGHYHRLRLPTSRNGPSRKDIAHMRPLFRHILSHLSDAPTELNVKIKYPDHRLGRTGTGSAISYGEQPNARADSVESKIKKRCREHDHCAPAAGDQGLAPRTCRMHFC